MAQVLIVQTVLWVGHIDSDLPFSLVIVPVVFPGVDLGVDLGVLWHPTSVCRLMPPKQSQLIQVISNNSMVTLEPGG
ncbi:hypothetical protein [Moorena bouillonii]|uniref:Uncharacterized protein n=1 Tax=Moorena bouillonii PNG TaxID=568701 RepID=A0A1U7MVM6_9CYAN|nr:hypothetical protein [Moorena bouillonii]OLT57722.1 hypothetical protein BJP37_00350 [Moorena bouillonii PNG]